MAGGRIGSVGTGRPRSEDEQRQPLSAAEGELGAGRGSPGSAGCLLLRPDVPEVPGAAGACSRSRWTCSAPGCSVRSCRRSRTSTIRSGSTNTCAQLGRDHRKFYVEPEHYEQVKFALIEALRVHAGDDWNLQYEQAWSDVYDLIAAKMIAGATEDDNPPYWYAEVLTHERRGTDIAVFTCRPLSPMPFRAGQYVSIECRYQPRLWRTYSMANAPRDDGTIDFHVTRGRRRLGVQRARSPTEARRPAQARGPDGLDDARPGLAARHRLRRRRHRPGPGQGHHRRAEPLQPDPVRAPVPRRAYARRPVRPRPPGLARRASCRG